MAQNQNRALSMLSIAAKAGKVQSGGFLTEKAIQEGVAYFVIIAEDASGNTQKKFMDKCKYYEIPYTIAFDDARQTDRKTGADGTCSDRCRSGKTDF